MRINNKGFSMIELMVVVAIIGIIMTIALPNYQKFKSKAKQTSAKAELTGVFMAEQNFSIEYGRYHRNLPYVGYVPDGIPMVTVGTSQCPTTTASEITSTRYYNVGFTTDEVAAVGSLGTPACSNRHFYPSTVVANAPTGADTAAGTFVAVASGELDGRLDVWQIDQNKSLRNTTNGAN
jgi:type IV pilus assembly protein PilA